MSEIQTTSTQPYLIRAWFEWCNDNGLTPYLSVRADRTVQVPREFVKDGEIVLNISYDATNALKLGNDYIEFTARFGGVPREIVIPVSRVVAIFARETGQGMGFPPPPELLEGDAEASMQALQAAADAAEPDAEGGPAVVQLVPSQGSVVIDESDDPPEAPKPPPTGGRPSLKRVK
ncbi:hypothetical protein GCM10027082_18790 [Comamonas humi]